MFDALGILALGEVPGVTPRTPIYPTVVATDTNLISVSRKPIVAEDTQSVAVVNSKTIEVK